MHFNLQKSLDLLRGKYDYFFVSTLQKRGEVCHLIRSVLSFLFISELQSKEGESATTTTCAFGINDACKIKEVLVRFSRSEHTGVTSRGPVGMARFWSRAQTPIYGWRWQEWSSSTANRREHFPSVPPALLGGKAEEGEEKWCGWKRNGIWSRRYIRRQINQRGSNLGDKRQEKMTGPQSCNASSVVAQPFLAVIAAGERKREVNGHWLRRGNVNGVGRWFQKKDGEEEQSWAGYFLVLAMGRPMG